MNMSINTRLFVMLELQVLSASNLITGNTMCFFNLCIYENINFYVIFSKCGHWHYCVLLVVMTCSRGPCLYPFHFNFNFAVNIYLPTCCFAVSFVTMLPLFLLRCIVPNVKI